jgi:hypothetical protein
MWGRLMNAAQNAKDLPSTLGFDASTNRYFCKKTVRDIECMLEYCAPRWCMWYDQHPSWPKNKMLPIRSNKQSLGWPTNLCLLDQPRTTNHPFSKATLDPLGRVVMQMVIIMTSDRTSNLFRHQSDDQALKTKSNLQGRITIITKR